MKVGSTTRSVAVVLMVGSLIWVFSMLFSVRYQLAKQEIEYNESSTSFASPTLTEFTCWYEVNGKVVHGPRITGTLLSVEDPGFTEEGVFCFTVRSKTFRDYHVQIEFDSELGEDHAFHVVNAATSGLSIHFPNEGLIGSP